MTMATEYLSPTGSQSYAWSARDLCIWDGSEWAPGGCFCRQCPSCTEYWKDTERADYSDGRPSIKPCPECAEAA